MRRETSARSEPILWQLQGYRVCPDVHGLCSSAVFVYLSNFSLSLCLKNIDLSPSVLCAVSVLRAGREAGSEVG